MLSVTTEHASLSRKHLPMIRNLIRFNINAYSHRLSTIAQSDVIVVLHKGKVVEKGSHAELLARGGQYHRMWEKQSNVRETATVVR